MKLTVWKFLILKLKINFLKTQIVNFQNEKKSKTSKFKKFKILEIDLKIVKFGVRKFSNWKFRNRNSQN